MDYRRLKKILIIKPSSLGDVIHALPVAYALKAKIPGADIDWVIGAGYEELLEGNPAVNRTITFNRRLLQGGGGFRNLRGFVGELRRERYDLVIDLQGLLRSALMAFACRSDARLGFANAREGAPLFYTGRVAVPDLSIHAVDRYLLALKFIGIENPGVPRFDIVLEERHDKVAVSLLKEFGIGEGEGFAAIAPSARWLTKRWPAENFVNLANKINNDAGLKTVFVGTKDEEAVLAGHMDKLVIKNLAFGRTSIKGLAALLKRARLLVTNDSGPMHIAAAVGTPVAAIFGPTDPVRTGPYGRVHRVITAGAGCAPCLKRECADVKCLTGLSVDAVFDEVNAMLLA